RKGHHSYEWRGKRDECVSSCFRVSETSKGDWSLGACATRLAASAASRQRTPCRERVHVVPPVGDLALVDVNDGAEAIVVGRAVRQDRSVDLVLDHDNASAVCVVDDEMVGGVQLDGLHV